MPQTDVPQCQIAVSWATVKDWDGPTLACSEPASDVLRRRGMEGGRVACQRHARMAQVHAERFGTWLVLEPLP